MPHVETQLLAYLDGELSPADAKAVEAHITTCRSCAAALAELRALRAGLTQVIPAAFAVVQLPKEAEERIRNALAAERARQAQAGSLGQAWNNLLAGLASALAGLSKAGAPLIALFFIILTINAGRLPSQAGIQQTVLLGRDTFTPGTEAAVRVLVREEETSQPIAGANVTVRMKQAGLARTLFTGNTDASGSIPVQFQVPGDWQGEAELEIETSSELGNNRIVEPIHLERSYRLLLSSDKPVYQPGETIHLRTLALGSIDGRPASGETHRFQIFAPDETNLLDQRVNASDFGIASVDLKLDKAASQGRYQLRASLGDTLSEMSVQVSQAELPAFRVDIEADATYYLPGDLLSGQVNANYFFGKPLAGAAVALRLLGSRSEPGGDVEADRIFVTELRGQTDQNGLFSFQIELPTLPDSAFGLPGILPLDLEAAVSDASGQREFAWQKLTLARQPIFIDVVAEGGVLRAGIENLLYVLTSYPDGQPAPASLAIQIDDGAIIEDVTGDFGLADIRYTPRAGDSGVRHIRVTARDAAGRAGQTIITLPLDETQEILLLRSDRAIYRVGETLALEVLATGGDIVYLDIVKGSQTLLSLSAPVTAGKAALGIDLTPDLAGTLELYAYQVTASGSALRDNRVIVVDAPEGLQVQLTTDRPEYRPGEEAVLTASVLAGNQPVEAAVGLAAVNEAVYAQREYQPGYARLYFILDEALQQSGISLPDAGQSPDDRVQALQAAQQQAAKATWTSYPGQDFTLAAQSADVESRDAANQERQQAFRRISLGLSLALGLAPLLLAGVVLFGLRGSGMLGKATSRALATIILLALAGAALLSGLQSGLATLTGRAELGVLAGIGLLWLAAWIGLALYGWRNRDSRAQYIAALLLAYIIFLALMNVVAGEAGQPDGLVLALLAAGFGLLLAALLIFGWGLRLEGERLAGWLALLLAVLALPLVIAFMVVAESSDDDLIPRITGPAVYGLQSGLLTGCASPIPQSTMAELAQEAAPAARAPQEMPAEATFAPAQEVASPEEIAQEAVVEAQQEEAPQAKIAGAEIAVEEEPPQPAEWLAESAGVQESGAALPDDQASLPSAAAMEDEPMLVEETPMAEGVAPAAIASKPADESTPVPADLETAPIEAPEPEPEEATAAPMPAFALVQPEAATFTPTVAPLAEEALSSGEVEEEPTATLRPESLTVAPTPTAAERAVTTEVLPRGTPTATPTATEIAASAAQAPSESPTPRSTPAPEPQPTPLPTETSAPVPAAEMEVAPALETPSLAPPASADELPAPAVGRAAPTPIPPESLPIIRQRFPQTLYWNPEIVTDEDGQLQVRIPTGDSITTWRLTALAVSRDGALGSASLPMVVFQPLFVQPQIADPLYVGDVIYAPVQIFNYSSQPLLVTLSAQTSPGLAARVSELPFRVPANESLVVPMELRVLEAGEQSITLVARDDRGIQDARQVIVDALPEPAG